MKMPSKHNTANFLFTCILKGHYNRKSDPVFLVYDIVFSKLRFCEGCMKTRKSNDDKKMPLSTVSASVTAIEKHSQHRSS